MSEVSNLWVTLSARTAPFMASMKAAQKEGTTFTEKMGGTRAAITKIGAASLAVGAVVAVSAVKMAGDFQAKMNVLQTAAGETSRGIKVVSSGILSLARKTGTSVNNLADGMYTVEKAGYRGADGLKVLTAAAEGAREENANLADVTNAMTSVMASYHLKASDSVRVMNALKTAAGDGKMTMEQFSSSISTVIPIAASAHVSFAQVAGAIATLTQHGTSAQEATQELSNTIRNLQAPNNVAVQEMQRLGLSSNDVAQKLGTRGLTGTLQLLSQTVLQKMGPAGTVLLSAFNKSKVAGEDEKKMLDSMPASVRKVAESYSTGAISYKTYRTQMKALPGPQANLLNQFKALHDKVNGFSTQLKAGGPAAQTYDAAIKAMTGGATGLNTTLMLTGSNMPGFASRVDKVSASMKDGGKNVEGWAQTSKTFNVQMGRLKETLDTVLIVIGTKLIPVILSVITFFEKHRTATIALAAVLGVVLVGAIVAATVAVWSFTASLLANPVTWVVLGIMALITAVVLLATHWRTVWNGIKTVASAVGSFITAVWRRIESVTMSVFNAIKGFIMPIFNGIKNVITTAVNSIWHVVSTVWNTIRKITTTVFDAVLKFFKKWWPLLLVIFMPPIALLLALWNHCHKTIEKVAKDVWNAIAKFFKTLWKGIAITAKAIWDTVKTAIEVPVKAVWNDVIKPVWNAVSRFLGAIWSGISSTARTWWRGIKESIVSPISGAVSDVEHFVGNIASGLWNGLLAAWKFVNKLAGQFAGIGWNIVMGIIHGVENAAGSLFSSLKSLASGALNAAKSFLGIGSPSKLFADKVGQWIPAGIAVGITQHGTTAQTAVRALSQQLVDTASGHISTGSVAAAITTTPTSAVAGAPAQTAQVATTINLDGRVLYQAMQKQALQYGRRNVSNGLALNVR